MQSLRLLPACVNLNQPSTSEDVKPNLLQSPPVPFQQEHPNVPVAPANVKHECPSDRASFSSCFNSRPTGIGSQYHGIHNIGQDDGNYASIVPPLNNQGAHSNQGLHFPMNQPSNQGLNFPTKPPPFNQRAHTWTAPSFNHKSNFSARLPCNQGTRFLTTPLYDQISNFPTKSQFISKSNFSSASGNFRKPLSNLPPPLPSPPPPPPPPPCSFQDNLPPPHGVFGTNIQRPFLNHALSSNMNYSQPIEAVAPGSVPGPSSWPQRSCAPSISDDFLNNQLNSIQTSNRQTPVLLPPLNQPPPHFNVPPPNFTVPPPIFISNQLTSSTSAQVLAMKRNLSDRCSDGNSESIKNYTSNNKHSRFDQKKDLYYNRPMSTMDNSNKPIRSTESTHGANISTKRRSRSHSPPKSRNSAKLRSRSPVRVCSSRSRQSKSTEKNTASSRSKSSRPSTFEKRKECDRSRDSERHGDRERCRENEKGGREKYQERKKSGGSERSRERERSKERGIFREIERETHGDRERSRGTERRKGKTSQEREIRSGRRRSRDIEVPKERERLRERDSERHGDRERSQESDKREAYKRSRESEKREGRKRFWENKGRESRECPRESEKRQKIERYDYSSHDSGKSHSRSLDSQKRLDKWRLNNCNDEEEASAKFSAQVVMGAEEIINREKHIWTRSAPAELHYTQNMTTLCYESTERVRNVCSQLNNVIGKFKAVKASKPPFNYNANRKKLKGKCSHCAAIKSKEDLSSSSSSEDEGEEETWMAELRLKQNHPDRLHPELWFNDKGEMNDGPLCRCSIKSRRSGIRHNIYAGEEEHENCNPDSNNANKLYHYRVTVSPPTNFLIDKPTAIHHDDHEFLFEGFSLLSHHPLGELPTCTVIRFNIQYTIVYIEEKVPSNFTVRETDIFFDYFFHEILELVDLDLRSGTRTDGCPQFHILPRFVREISDNGEEGKELLPMYRVLEHFIRSYVPVISEELAKGKEDLSVYEWQDFADEVKGMIIAKPGSKPCAIRVDQLDRESETNDSYPDIVHFGSRPLQLCFAGSPEFQRVWKAYVKLRHLVANKSKRSAEDKKKLAQKEAILQEMRTNTKMKRSVTVGIGSRGFYRTGVMCDMVQHAMLIPVLIGHLRFHRSLDVLEERIQYKFSNRYLLQLALTHPSYRENFGTNPDHARNTLTNCGVRQPEYGDRKIHFQNTRKRGINTLISIMSKLGRQKATESAITHNERLEFLGDAVVEFVTSIHLFHVFPDIEEGGLATYRAAIVQNQHLAHLAKKIGLEDFMLYAHGSDLCHEVELKHAMANCYEALMGALYLDGGIKVADDVFSRVLYQNNGTRFNEWMNYPKHPLQDQEPVDDRAWVAKSPLLTILQSFEASTGITFRHIRLLARVFSTRSVGYTNLTLGSNQRLEFLGDTVLQLITSVYLYNHFPEHHEGHLSLLRSSLVNNRTQSVVCDDIRMPLFAKRINPKVDLKMKDRADLLEALLGAMYIDKGMEACEVFCQVCFFPRLEYFILTQGWNDAKSKLQQCCLTLRTLDGGEPDIPIYKVIASTGPTNSRTYTVAVYFKQERLAEATGNSIQDAQMNAAEKALQKCPSICPQLEHQKRVIAKSIKMQKNQSVIDK